MESLRTTERVDGESATRKFFLLDMHWKMWWSGSWLGRGSNITELLVRTLDNTQSVIGKVPNVNMLNLPNLCPRSEILEVLPSARPMPQENSGGTSDDENTEDASWTAGKLRTDRVESTSNNTATKDHDNSS